MLQLRSGQYLEYSLILRNWSPRRKAWRNGNAPYLRVRSSSVPYVTRGSTHRYGPLPPFFTRFDILQTKWDRCFTSVSVAFLATFELVYYSLGVRPRSRLNFEFWPVTFTEIAVEITTRHGKSEEVAEQRWRWGGRDRGIKSLSQFCW